MKTNKKGGQRRTENFWFKIFEAKSFFRCKKFSKRFNFGRTIFLEGEDGRTLLSSP
jgi:hypothetical protein